MAGRENTEADLLDLHIRRHLYQGSPYAFECGGLTPEIRRLDLDAIRRYHQSQYRLDNIAVVVCGIVDVDDALEKMSEALGRTFVSNGPGVEDFHILPKGVPPLALPVTDTVYFPSSDEAVGSIAFAWRGPSLEDYTTIIALEVLLRYLQNNASSPLCQKFVECEDPWATSVDYDIKSFAEVGIVLYFSGVPFKADSEEFEDDRMSEDQSDDEEGSDSDEEMDSTDGDDRDSEEAESEQEAEQRNCFAPGVFRERLMEVLSGIAENGIPPAELQATIRRMRRKIIEAVEEDTHEVSFNYLLPDLLRLPATRLQSGEKSDRNFSFGSRSEVLSTLSILAGKAPGFWADLCRTYLINAVSVEVMALPSKERAQALSDDNNNGHLTRKEKLGEAGLQVCGEVAERASQASRAELSPSSLSSLPNLPAIENLSKIPRTVVVGTLEGGPRPFHDFVLVETETQFSHVRFGLNSSHLPTDVKGYIVLFQELLFETDVEVPLESGSKGFFLDYTEVAKKSSESFVTYESAFGFGNDIFAATWLSEVFMLCASVEPQLLFGEQTDQVPSATESSVPNTGSILFLLHILLFSKFTRERVKNAANKLLTDLTESKRDGASVLAAINSRVMSSSNSNDVAMNLLNQEDILRQTVKDCSSEKAFKRVAQKLEAIRENLVLNSRAPGFIQLAMGIAENTKMALKRIMDIWDSQVKLYVATKRVKAPATINEGPRITTSFPFPRSGFRLEAIAPELRHPLLIPVKGINAGYFSVTVPCDVLNSEDRFAGR
ncbi:hypothetical protein HDU96_010567 [Phlyctochytrium bullatum]|nr:hypothetical protein HDU96_010567 [Phlyctochytrium bullatum]